jgi:hypothetical protein
MNLPALLADIKLDGCHALLLYKMLFQTKRRAIASVLLARLTALKQTTTSRRIQRTGTPSCLNARSLCSLVQFWQIAPLNVSAARLRVLQVHRATLFIQTSNNNTATLLLTMADDPSAIRAKEGSSETTIEGPNEATPVDDHPESTNEVHDKKRQHNQGGNKKGQRKKARADRKIYTRKQDGDGSRMAVHPGSFASASMRELFKVSLPPHLLPPENPPTCKNYDEEKEKRAFTKKKVAFLLGYLGTGYSGFQTNEGRRTLQAEFELALVKSELISPLNFGYFNKYSWSTSGRTDKGK